MKVWDNVKKDRWPARYHVGGLTRLSIGGRIEDELAARLWALKRVRKWLEWQERSSTQEDDDGVDVRSCDLEQLTVNLFGRLEGQTVWLKIKFDAKNKIQNSLAWKR